MSKHQPLDRLKWREWFFVSDTGHMYNREWVAARGGTKVIMAAANTTVIIDRMLRKGRAAWRMRQ